MKAIHKAENWRIMHTNDGGRNLCYRNAPVDKEGTMYPPIEWETIVKGYLAVRNKPLQCRLPPPYALGNGSRVIGFVWEICARHELGEAEVDNQQVRDLVCAVHQHLGSAYNELVIA